MMKRYVAFVVFLHSLLACFAAQAQPLSHYAGVSLGAMHIDNKFDDYDLAMTCAQFGVVLSEYMMLDAYVGISDAYRVRALSSVELRLISGISMKIGPSFGAHRPYLSIGSSSVRAAWVESGKPDQRETISSHSLGFGYFYLPDAQRAGFSIDAIIHQDNEDLFMAGITAGVLVTF